VILHSGTTYFRRVFDSNVRLWKPIFKEKEKYGTTGRSSSDQRDKGPGRVPGKNLGGESIRTSGHLEEMAEFEIQASVKLAYACLGFRVVEERALAKRITPVRYRQGVAERFPKYKQSVPLYTFIGRQLDFDADFLMDIKGGVDLSGSTDVVWTNRDADHLLGRDDMIELMRNLQATVNLAGQL
jgi:hypothetical protein